MKRIKKILKIAGLCWGVALVGCAQSTLPSITQSEVVLPESAVYALPNIQQSYIAPHVTRAGLWQGGHEVYWLKEKGHWVVPQTGNLASSHRLIEVYQPPGI